MTDNIAEGETQEPVAPTSHQPHMMGSLTQMSDQISKHYGKGFDGLRYRFPLQIVDGSVVEFIDDSGTVPTIIAAARLRFRNRVLVQENGDMYAEILMSDLTFSQSVINVKISSPPEPVSQEI